MTRLDRARAVAFIAALLGGLLAAAPVGAGQARRHHDDVIYPRAAGVAALEVGASSAVACAGCTVDPAVAEHDRHRNATLSVNIAIMVLGGLWLALMVRRIQQHSALTSPGSAGFSSDDLGPGVPQPSASGH